MQSDERERVPRAHRVTLIDDEVARDLHRNGEGSRKLPPRVKKMNR
jgi:hypothetical protein